MKRIYFILIILSAFTSKISAQSFSLININNYIHANTSYNPFGLSVDVVNNSNSAKDVNMFRKINNVASGHSSNFCWGNFCYGSIIDTSQNVLSMPAGGSNNAIADLNAYNIAGYSEVTYCWYDVNNPADSVCLKFTYDLTAAVGINELTATVDFVSLPHPNPADLSTVLVYYLKNHDADSRIVIYNVIGSKVLEMKLDNSKHDVQLNTSDFQPGVYFYSFISGGKAISTNKLIVSHKN